jgi:hypothetical protein
VHVRRRFAATAILGRPAEGQCCAEMKNRSSPTDAEKIEKLAMATIEEALMVLPGIQGSTLSPDQYDPGRPSPRCFGIFQWENRAVDQAV